MDYSNIKIGDLVIYTSNDPIAWIIRSKTAGVGRIFDKTVATHVGVVCKMEDQFLVCGMREKIAIESLEDKDIISITRNNLLTDDNRKEINKQIAYGVRKSLDYDWAGVMKFMFKDLKQVDSKFYCSEYFVYLTKQWIKYPKEMYSPYDLQTMTGFTTIWKRK